MSASAVTERVRRLEEAGVIQGYAAVVDPESLGLPILAFVRLRYPNGNYKPFHDLVEATPEILEAHHVTGDDCFVIKVAARSMNHLEKISGRIGTLGSVTTSVVYSSPLPGAPGSLIPGDPPTRSWTPRCRTTDPVLPFTTSSWAWMRRRRSATWLTMPTLRSRSRRSRARRGPRPGSGRRGCRNPRR